MNAPPRETSTKPTGTLAAPRTYRAKYQATAEMDPSSWLPSYTRLSSPARSDLRHTSSTSLVGDWEYVRRGAAKRSASSAAICASALPFASCWRADCPHTGNCMLLCPPAIYTSPTSTSLIVRDPTFRSRPLSDAGNAGSVTHQFPLASAVAEARLPPKLASTRSPGAAVPHTGTGRSRWSIIPSEKKLDTVAEHSRTEARRQLMEIPSQFRT